MTLQVISAKDFTKKKCFYRKVFTENADIYFTVNIFTEKKCNFND